LALPSLPPQAATANARAAKLDVIVTGVGAASGATPPSCTSILLIVSTRFSLTAGSAILLGRGARRGCRAAHEPAIRDELPSNNS
jgi:hypothetical protein